MPQKCNPVQVSNAQAYECTRCTQQLTYLALANGAWWKPCPDEVGVQSGSINDGLVLTRTTSVCLHCGPQHPLFLGAGIWTDKVYTCIYCRTDWLHSELAGSHPLQHQGSYINGAGRRVSPPPRVFPPPPVVYVPPQQTLPAKAALIQQIQQLSYPLGPYPPSFLPPDDQDFKVKPSTDCSTCGRVWCEALDGPFTGKCLYCSRK